MYDFHWSGGGYSFFTFFDGSRSGLLVVGLEQKRVSRSYRQPVDFVWLGGGGMVGEAMGSEGPDAAGGSPGFMQDSNSCGASWSSVRVGSCESVEGPRGTDHGNQVD